MPIVRHTKCLLAFPCLLDTIGIRNVDGVAKSNTIALDSLVENGGGDDV